MRNENNVMEWFIALKKDGSLFIAHESINGQAGAGIVNEIQAAEFKKLAFGDNWKETIKEFTE